MLRFPAKGNLQILTAGVLCTSAFVFAVHSPAAAQVIPDLSGQWGRNTGFFEPPPSGPGPVVSRIRNPDGTLKLGAPWVGDYTNPILKPEAAEAVRRRGEMATRGTIAADLHNSCWPEPPPYAMAQQFGVNILQRKDEITLIYLLGNTVRHVRLNSRHPANLTPSWQGDSIGHYEGDTLVVDTIGIKTAPISTVDPFGTPHSDALHVIERYRLIDGAAAADAERKQGAARLPEGTFYGRGPLDPNKKGLQVTFKVEDEGVFTTPWSARVTYQRVIGEWPEALCAENPQFLGITASTIPTADRPDFYREEFSRAM
jgi:hypothetical protein